jgi:uncharacterized protein
VTVILMRPHRQASLRSLRKLGCVRASKDERPLTRGDMPAVALRGSLRSHLRVTVKVGVVCSHWYDVGIPVTGHHMNGMSERAENPTAKPCPICGKPAVREFQPFCTRRCANVDLNRWLKGVYAVPVKEEEDEDGAPRGEGES